MPQPIEGGMHQHRCPACLTDFEHERFVYQHQWNPIERVAARALHRAVGACGRCIAKFINVDFRQDPEAVELMHALAILSRNDLDGLTNGGEKSGFVG